MVTARRGSVGWAVSLLAFLAGCASPSPDLYSLDMQPGPTQASSRQVIVVRAVSVPRYLEREQIVREAGGTRLRTSENDWWSEPFRVMLIRVLAADLAQRLPGADVLGGGGSIAAHPDAEITVDLQRFDGNLSGPVILEGYAAVIRPQRARALERLHVEAKIGADTAKGQVDAMSAALGQAADIIAAQIAR